MPTPTDAQIKAGQAVYTRNTLSIYDVLVLGVSNRFIWKCPTPELLAHYNRHLSDNHLDVGVGTGYFLDKATFAQEKPRIGLMDLNPETLDYAAQRIAGYQPLKIQHNVFEPLAEPIEPFDSIGVNYLLHCLPGTMQEKSVVFAQLKPLLTPGGRVFGSTILAQDVPRSWTAKKLMQLYNRKGIFTNLADNQHALKAGLESHFTNVKIQQRGVVAMFSADNA